MIKRLTEKPPATSLQKSRTHFFLLGVNTDHRITRRDELLGETVEIAELAIAVRVGGAFFDLGR